MNSPSGDYNLWLILLYMLPSVIALARWHLNKFAIFWLNLLLGWTVLGWIAAFIWSLTNPVKHVVTQVTQVNVLSRGPSGRREALDDDSGPPLIDGDKFCPGCKHDVPRSAAFCPHCGLSLADTGRRRSRLRDFLLGND